VSRYLFRRIGFVAITFFTVVSLVFFMLRAAPGGPFDGERQLPPEIEANLRAAYNLDAPLPSQYLTYWLNLSQGNLGPSFRHKDFTVNDLIASGLPVSAKLGGLALLLGTLLGLSVGTLAGLNQQRFLDRFLMTISNINLAIPTIVSAPLLVLVFSVMLRWLPGGGADTGLHFLLPSIALALPLSAEIARLTRGSVAEAKLEPHVVTALSKGLSRTRITLRHIMPIAIIPVLSFLGPAAAGLLTGTVVAEQIFDLPGIGRYYVQAALNRDYTLVMGVTIVYAAAILTFNLIVDLLYGYFDPRIRAVGS
jgi:oligopeptide transport system permease protein